MPPTANRNFPRKQCPLAAHRSGAFNQSSAVAFSLDANQLHNESKEISASMISGKDDMYISITGIISLLVLVIGVTDGYSQDGGRCQAYWQERNMILKEYRYCFKSPRAIQYFGNGGCTYQRIEDIPFLKPHLDRMLEIRAMERSLRCGPRLTFSR